MPLMSDRENAFLQTRFQHLGPATIAAFKECVRDDPTTKAETQHPSAPKLVAKDADTCKKWRKGDREAALRSVDRLMKGNCEWSRMPLRERVQFVVDGYDQKMRQREGDRYIRCGKREFPGHYDRTADLMWLVPEFAEYLKESKKEGKHHILKRWLQQEREDEDEDGDGDDSEAGGEVVVKREDREDEPEGAGDGEHEEEADGDERRDIDDEIRGVETKLEKLRKRKRTASE